MVSHSACQAGVSIKKEEFVTKETFEMLIPGLLQAPEEMLHNVASYPCRSKEETHCHRAPLSLPMSTLLSLSHSTEKSHGQSASRALPWQRNSSTARTRLMATLITISTITSEA